MVQVAEFQENRVCLFPGEPRGGGLRIGGGQIRVGHIEIVRRKVGQLPGVLGRAAAVLDGGSFPHSIMGWSSLPHSV